MTKRLTLDQFSAWLVQQGPKLEQAGVRGMRKAGAFLVGEVVRQIDRAEPRPAVDTGELRNSANLHPHPDGAIVSVDAPHAAFVEYGRRPGRMPPPQPIEDWVRRKSAGDLTEAEIKSAAYAIRRSIALNGIVPRHYFRKAWDASTGTMSTILVLEIAKTGWRPTSSATAKINAMLRAARRAGGNR